MQRENISIDRREDFFSGFPGMLSLLVDDLLLQKRPHDAKGILLRNNLTKADLGAKNWDALEGIEYQKDLDMGLCGHDSFGPVVQVEE